MRLDSIIFAFFFLSGFSSLVFEVLWERSLAKVFGTTSLALSTLLTAFMAGLALGSFLGGRLAPRLKRPLRAYGLLEGTIGLYALLVPLLLAALPSIYDLVFDRFVESFWLFAGIRFVVVFVILVVPTTLMGATLPIVTHWLSGREHRYQSRVGALYAMNTAGACSGAFLAGFVLLPRLGLHDTNITFAIANLTLCAIVLAMEPRLNRPRPTADPDALPEAELIVGRVDAAAVPPAAIRRGIFAFGVLGMVSMTYQVLWTRAYVIVLGSSTYSFTLILTTFLLGLAVGSAVASALVERIRHPTSWLAVTQLALVTAAAWAFRFLDTLPDWLFDRLRAEIGRAEEIYLFHFFLVAILVFIPVALQGMAFPLAVRAYVPNRDDASRDVGAVYAVNTAGAIVGAFVAGFLLLPTLGLRGAMTLALAANLIAALTFGASPWRPLRPRRATIVAVAVLLAVVSTAFGPALDKALLTRGMFRTYWARELFDRQKYERDRPELLFYADGVAATTSVERRGRLITLKSNGKAEASDGADMATQILVALMPLMARSVNHPIGGERVAMVGFGSGVTAGAALQWPLAHMDVVEIEPSMVGASRHFEHVNHRPLEDDRTRLVHSDGRNFLEYQDGEFDVIVSEPSNPWIAGVASLFTREHFLRAKARLSPGGVFGQWVQLYEISPDNVRVILATFAEAFPHVQAYSSMPKGTDLILLGSETPIDLPHDGFAKAWANPTIRAELERAGVSSPHDPIGLMFMNQQELQAFAAGAPINTDDNGLLEFAAPRDLIRYDVGEDFFAARYFRASKYGDPRPHLARWPDQWDPSARGKLATAAWKAGKRELADELAGVDDRDAHLEKLAEAPEGLDGRRATTQLDRYLLARHAEDLDLDEAFARAWPGTEPQWLTMVADTAAGQKHLQAMIWLEKDGLPPRGGFEGERGLVYAWVLAQRRYYRHALEQLEGLEQAGDPNILESLPYRLLAGFVRSKRRRFERAFEHYLDAGLSLLQPAPAPQPDAPGQ